MGAPDRGIDLAKAAHRMLLDSAAGVSDGQARQPSLLPGWSLGHVLTHLARNADGHTGQFRAASRGEAAQQYPGGPAQRARDIEAGAGRTRRRALRRSGCRRTAPGGRLGGSFDHPAWRTRRPRVRSDAHPPEMTSTGASSVPRRAAHIRAAGGLTVGRSTLSGSLRISRLLADAPIRLARRER